MNDRDGRAPVALTRNQPVTQAEVGCLGTSAALLKNVDGFGNRILLRQAVEIARVDHHAVAAGRNAGRARVVVFAVGRRHIDDDLDGQVKLECEVEVALVVRGHSHDGAVTVVSEHVIGRPNRQFLAVERVDAKAAEEYTGLGAVGCLAFDFVRLLHLGEVLRESGLSCGIRASDEFTCEVGIRCDHHERGAKQRVRARGENSDGFVATFDGELHVGTLRATDPVALHRQHLARPVALEFVEVVEQAVGVVGDLEVPLCELLLDDHRTGAFGRAIGQNLLVGKHCLVYRVPVDPRVFAVGEALLVHLEEQPLVPLVVLGVARVKHASPVEARGVASHRLLLLLDVVVGPRDGVQSTLDGRVLSRQTEGVPANGVQHVEVAVAPVASNHIAQRVGLSVTHVQVAGGVRKHVEHVLAVAGVIRVVRAEWLQFVPDRQPLFLDFREVERRFLVLSHIAFEFTWRVSCGFTPATA